MRVKQKKNNILQTDLFHCVPHLENTFELYIHKNDPENEQQYDLNNLLII